MKLSARALSLLPRTYNPAGYGRMVPNVDGTPLTMRLIAAYAAQNPGLEFGNYCSGWNDKEGRAAYFSESRAITRDLRRVREALRAAYFAGATDADVIEATRSAFSGRLSIERIPCRSESQQLAYEARKTCGGIAEAPPADSFKFRIDYCVGQYWPTEYRKACASVLEYAARIAARRNEAQREKAAA